MGQERRNLPVGIQSFEKIIENNNLYIDKTEYIYRMVHTNVPYFMSRPRRFGKSLLLSTLKAYVDCTLEADRFVYVFEFKRDDSADNALKQINDMDYAAPYAADKRTVFKIGVNFDSETRQLQGWKAETL